MHAKVDEVEAKAHDVCQKNFDCLGISKLKRKLKKNMAALKENIWKHCWRKKLYIYISSFID